MQNNTENQPATPKEVPQQQAALQVKSQVKAGPKVIVGRPPLP